MPVETKPLHRNGNHAPPIRLPDWPETKNVGAGVVRRAVSLTFLVLATVFAGALVVAFLVEIDVTVDAGGVLEPVTIWPVRSQEPGLLAQVHVVTGDTVETGQALASLDSLQLYHQALQLEADRRAQRLAYTQAQAASGVEQREHDNVRAQAQAAVVRARATLREQLTTYGFGSNIDSVLSTYRVGTHIAIDQALADVQTAEAALRSTQTQRELLTLGDFDLRRQQVELERLDAQIQSLRHRLGRLTLRAPASGVVLTGQLERLVGSYVREGELLLEVAALDVWRVNLFVRERDVHEIHTGDQAKVEVQAFLGKEEDLIYGRVVTIAAESSSFDETPTGLYRVTVVLDEAEVERVGRDKLRRGYSAQGKIITRSGRIIKLLVDYVKEQANV